MVCIFAVCGSLTTEIKELCVALLSGENVTVTDNNYCYHNISSKSDSGHKFNNIMVIYM